METLKLLIVKKNLIKPPHGEYIALEKLESAYRNCNVFDFILVYVDSQHFHCIALGVPNRDRAIAWAKENSNPNEDFGKLCTDPAFIHHALNELKNTGRKLKLKSIETVRAVHLCAIDWTPQNNMLTAAMKLNRNEIVKAFRPQIDKMYESLADE